MVLPAGGDAMIASIAAALEPDEVKVEQQDVVPSEDFKEMM